MKTTKGKAPFGWVGGKSKLAKEIITTTCPVQISTMEILN